MNAFPPIDAADSGRPKPISDLGPTVLRLRSRAWMLRIQAFVVLAVLTIASLGIGWIFISLHKVEGGRMEVQKSREPYDYRLMESRHEEMSSRLKDMAESLTETKQELISDKYGVKPNQLVVAKLLQNRIDEISTLRSDLDVRISKDRQNLYLEINQLRAERDRAREDGAEKRSFIKLVGDAVMRVGVLVLAMYIIAILSNIVKYWLRVADHLNSVADSLDLLRAAGLSVEPAIAALTPHAIDFQVEDITPSKNLSDVLSSATGFRKNASGDKGS